jgi:hypothetical protein
MQRQFANLRRLASGRYKPLPSTCRWSTTVKNCHFEGALATEEPAKKVNIRGNVAKDETPVLKCKRFVRFGVEMA